MTNAEVIEFLKTQDPDEDFEIYHRIDMCGKTDIVIQMPHLSNMDDDSKMLSIHTFIELDNIYLSAK